MKLYFIVFAFTVLLVSYLIYDEKVCLHSIEELFWPNNQSLVENNNIFSENDSLSLFKKWDTVIAAEKNNFKNVVIGLNANLDLIISSRRFLELNNIIFTKEIKKSDHAVLHGLQDLKESLLYFMNKGAAAERPFLDKSLFHQLVSQALSSHEKEVSIGGNAALIAQNMRPLYSSQVQFTLVAPVGPNLLKLLHKNITVPKDCQDLTDEVHVILEYGRDSQLCSECSKAPVANRFIFSHDESNSHLLKLDKLQELSKTADLMVLSGLHLCEVLSVDNWRIILGKLQQVLKTSSAYSHLELASMTDPFRLNDIGNQVLPFIYSLGLNEQELQFLGQSYAGPHLTLTSEDSSRPDVAKVVDTLEWLLTNKTGTRLSRIHFHSLTYHIIAVRADDFNHKALTLPSLASTVSAGARSVGIRACDIPIPDPTMQDIKMDSRVVRLGSSGVEHVFDSKNPDSWVVTWKTTCDSCKESYREIRFALSPVLVCQNPVKTVGLGDSISATGLLFTPKFL